MDNKDTKDNKGDKDDEDYLRDCDQDHKDNNKRDHLQ